MIRIERILWPCDFSEASRRGLAHATGFARWYGARITALHVLPLAPSGGALPPFVSPVTLEPVSREAIAAELRRFAAPALDAGVALEVAIAEGNAAAEVLEQARALPADLLVLGTHGRSGFERWALGSVAEKVLRKAPCPVLTVSHDGLAPGEPLFRRILCAIDFSSASLRGLDLALSVAGESGGRLTLIHVVEVFSEHDLRERRRFRAAELGRILEEDARRALAESVPATAREALHPELRAVSGRAAAEILRAAREAGAELIVMGVQGRGALDLMLFGSTTQQVVRQAGCPVLTVRAA